VNDIVRMSDAGVAGLREHRRLRALSYAAKERLWAVALVCIVFFLVMVAISYFFGGPIVAGAMGGSLVFAAALVGVVRWRASSVSAEEAQRYASLHAQLPTFLTSCSRALGAGVSLAPTLAETLRFLEAYGIGPVPQAALRRLNMRELSRHRIEGAHQGRPLALEVLLGKLMADANDHDPANPGVTLTVGPHLFVFVAGACEQAPPAVIHSFRVWPTSGGVTLQRSIANGFPTIEELVDVLGRLGPWRAPHALAPSTAEIAFTSAQAAGEAFLGALRDKDYGRALLATHPDIAYREELESSPASLESFARRAGLEPLSWSWPLVLSRKDFDLCWGGIRIRVPSGEMTAMLLFQHLVGSWRLLYCFVGAHELGRCSPHARYKSQ